MIAADSIPKKVKRGNKIPIFSVKFKGCSAKPFAKKISINKPIFKKIPTKKAYAALVGLKSKSNSIPVINTKEQIPKNK